MKSIGKKKLILIIVTAIILVTLIVIIVNKFNNDGMENSGILNVYYRTYTKEKGWSKWSKNGITSGNKKDNILNIEVKVKKKEKGLVVYRVYTINEDWSEEEYSIENKMKEATITGIKMGLTDTIGKKYSICYRTYNEESKWYNWACDGQASGNKEKEMKAIEIKVVPINVVYRDYLKDYKNASIKSEGF